MKREMTEEEREKLLGLLPVSKKTGIPYQPNIFGEELKDFAPTIYLRGWTVDEQKGFLSELQSAEKDNNYNEVMAKYAYCALIDIENLIDLSNSEFIEIPKNNGKVKEDFFKTLPTKLIVSIFQKVQEISGISKGEEEGLG